MHYVSFAEIELYEAEPIMGTGAAAVSNGSRWTDSTPLNIPFNDQVLPIDEAETAFICEKRIP
eukprot:SAG25_NODE_1547_length_2790_cov_1.502044_6_plen_63_part_00